VAAEDIELEEGGDEEPLELDAPPPPPAPSGAVPSTPAAPAVVVGTPIETPPAPAVKKAPPPEPARSQLPVRPKKNVDVPWGKGAAAVIALAIGWWVVSGMLEPSAEELWAPVGEALAGAHCPSDSAPFEIVVASTGPDTYSNASNGPGGGTCATSVVDGVALPLDGGGDVVMISMTVSVAPDGSITPGDDLFARRMAGRMKTSRVDGSNIPREELDDILETLRPSAGACLAQYAFARSGIVPGRRLYNEVPHVHITVGLKPDGGVDYVGHDSDITHADWRSKPEFTFCMDAVLKGATWPSAPSPSSFAIDIGHKIEEL
jgi:hypothetical protein